MKKKFAYSYTLRFLIYFFTPITILLPFTEHSAISQLNSCEASDFASEYVRAYLNKIPIENTEALSQKIDTIKLGECHQAQVVKLLSQYLGKPIGYKVAITNKKAQQQSGIEQPIVGVLLESMILPDGSTIASKSGGRLIYEVDLLVKVASEEINEAETIMDVTRHLEALIPFIEVADLMGTPSSKYTGPLLVAMNVGARWGVTGEAVAVEANPDFLDALANMKVTMADSSGQLIIEAMGKDILGHPFNSVLFLLKQLHKRGERLQKGDLISLGTFGRFSLVEPGKEIIASYEGISDQIKTVSVKFE